jgi:hypothetical protein
MSSEEKNNYLYGPLRTLQSGQQMKNVINYDEDPT